MMRGNGASTLPQRLAEEDRAAEAHLQAMKKVTAALDNLYRSLNADQKKIADNLMLGPMGMPLGIM